jgi:hypothetical protein
MMNKTFKRVYVTTITPNMATRYLATQIKNRKVRPAHVEELTQAMLAGTFPFSGDPIRFNSKGELIDGQHRLLACIKSQCHFDAIIVLNVPDEARDVIDTGMKRTPGDIFSLQGYTDGNNLTAILRWLWRYDMNYMIAYPIKPQIIDLKDAWSRHPDVQESLIVGQTTFRLITRSLGSALHCLFVEKDAKMGNDFFEKLHLGEGLFRGSSIYWLRKRLLNNTIAKAKLPYHEVAALTIKAFNAYRRGKKVQFLRWASSGAASEEFPKIK